MRRAAGGGTGEHSSFERDRIIGSLRDYEIQCLSCVAAGLVVAGSAFAGDKACCAQHAKNDKAACAASFAGLDLTAEQKSKMETLAAECDKSGCTKESMAKMDASAKEILSKEQYAAWQSVCKAKMTEKNRANPSHRNKKKRRRS